jgi:hypothetical protein
VVAVVAVAGPPRQAATSPARPWRVLRCVWTSGARRSSRMAAASSRRCVGGLGARAAVLLHGQACCRLNINRSTHTLPAPHTLTQAASSSSPPAARSLSKRDAASFVRAVRRFGLASRLADISAEAGGAVAREGPPAARALLAALSDGCSRALAAAAEQDKQQGELHDAWVSWY